MMRAKKYFSVFTFLIGLAAVPLLAGQAHAAAGDAAGQYCFAETYNRPMTMNVDGTCPDWSTKPEGINQCVIIEQQYGNLTIEALEDNAIRFNVSMIFPSEYACELQGTAEATGDNSWRYVETLPVMGGQQCILDITRAEDGSIAFADETEVCSRYYCGAQAYFYNIGFAAETKGAICAGDEAAPAAASE